MAGVAARPSADDVVQATASRADLHVHSRYSDRPTEWVLRRIGAPECYTPPRTVYDVARRRGMDFVTISDHNCIAGAAEIAHLPGTFVSNEATTYFPEDGCKVHVLCWDIDESQFNEIQRLRENIIDLRNYLCRERIAHSCAHPLYSVNDRLTLAHFERLLLLFNVFETLNGGRNRRGNDIVRTILEHLTPAHIEEMANRHGLEPVGDTPWIKSFSGGSDDHAGVFVAKGYTECPASRTPAEFLSHVAAGRSHARGLDGTPLSFAHSLYSIGYQYYRDRFLPKSASGGELAQRMFGELFGRDQMRVGLRSRVSYYARRLAGRSERPEEAEFKRMITTELATLFGKDWQADDIVANAGRYEVVNRRTFELASRTANQLLFQLTRKLVAKLSTGSVFGSIEALSAMGPILLGVAPYLFSFAHQSRDRHFLADARERFLGERPAFDSMPRKAWFIDDLADVHGVTTLVRHMCGQAERHGHDLTLVTFADRDTIASAPGRLHNFKPVGQFTLPENGLVTLGFPPFLDVLEYCERRELTELIVSSPSPAGLAAIAAARLLNIRLVGIYHTDLPQYVRYYTDDEMLEGATWRYLRWFYEQMDLIYVPSRGYKAQLVAKGFDPTKLRLFPHGVDVERFHPDRRDPLFWSRYGARQGPTVTYVGRVAKEKDLDVLTEVYDQLARRRPDCTLVVVGDGPFLAQMQDRLRHTNVVFTGFLFDDDLSRAYASSDIFVFPSTTDTFGNVVLEAMASGVPVVVSDKGGPSEIVKPGITGLVTRARNTADLLANVERLLDDAAPRRSLSEACRTYAETCDWSRIYLDFWRGDDCAPTAASDDDVERRSA